MVAHDVLRFQVAVDDSQAVSGFQGAADLLHELDRLFRGEFFLFLDQRAQVLALHELHGDELHTISIAQIVNTDDIPVGYLAGEQKFLFESGEDRGIGRQFRPDQLQGHKPVKFPVPRLVHGPHPALAEQLQDLIAAPQHVADLQDWGARLETGGSAAGRAGSRSYVDLRAIGIDKSSVNVHKGGIGVDQRSLGIGRRLGKLDYGSLGVSRRVGARTITLHGNANTARVYRVRSIFRIKPQIPVVHESPAWGPN